jgi:hypothetical protein
MGNHFRGSEYRPLRFNVLRLKRERSEEQFRNFGIASKFFLDARGYRQLWEDPASAERRKPKGPPAVARIDQRLRINSPRRLY